MSKALDTRGPAPKTFHLAGFKWEVKPLAFDEQIEVECIMLRTFGPSGGAALRAAASGIIPMLIELMREAAGKGEKFDMENLIVRFSAWYNSEDATSNPGLKQVWDDFLGVLSDTGGEMIEIAVASLAARVDARDIMRLFDLIVLSKKTSVWVNGTRNEVLAYAPLSGLLQAAPSAKWELFSRALGVTYGWTETDETGYFAEPGDEGDKGDA